MVILDVFWTDNARFSWDDGERYDGNGREGKIGRGKRRILSGRSIDLCYRPIYRR